VMVMAICKYGCPANGQQSHCSGENQCAMEHDVLFFLFVKSTRVVLPEHAPAEIADCVPIRENQLSKTTSRFA
jgi:hypothetical protein